MIESSCHCGAVRLSIARPPEEVTDCNCSICRRYGALWAYYSPKDVQVLGDATEVYTWGKKVIEFHRCRHCGCVTHWVLAEKTRAEAWPNAEDRMGVNGRLMAPDVLTAATVRHIDGADTWKRLD